MAIRANLWVEVVFEMHDALLFAMTRVSIMYSHEASHVRHVGYVCERAFFFRDRFGHKDAVANIATKQSVYLVAPLLELHLI